MRGSCLCGQVEYEASQLDSPIEHCSCRFCRKAYAQTPQLHIWASDEVPWLQYGPHIVA
jgi:hypothetical protein